MRTRPDRPRDAGLLGINWLVKLLVTLVVLGIAGYDGFSLLATRLRLTDQAGAAARAGAAALGPSGTTGSAGAASAAVRRYAADNDLRIVPGSLTVSGKTVSVTLEATSPSLVLGRLPRLKEWTHVEATGSGRPELT